MCLYFKNLGLEKYTDKLSIKREPVYTFRYLNYLKMVIWGFRLALLRVDYYRFIDQIAQ